MKNAVRMMPMTATAIAAISMMVEVSRGMGVGSWKLEVGNDESKT
jgi:hypothetical protein